jgi:hypothetical protein
LLPKREIACRVTDANPRNAVAVWRSQFSRREAGKDAVGRASSEPLQVQNRASRDLEFSQRKFPPKLGSANHVVLERQRIGARRCLLGRIDYNLAPPLRSAMDTLADGSMFPIRASSMDDGIADRIGIDDGPGLEHRAHVGERD